jgi:hypothetical protein
LAVFVSGQGKYEIALAHYPSLRDFAATLGSIDYQEVNKRYRIVGLRETCVLCTVEITDDDELAGNNTAEAKL